MKKLFTLFLALVMVAGMAACGKTDTPDNTGDNAENATYRVGVCQLAQHPALDAATQGFVDALKEALGDDVKIDVQNASGESTDCATIINGFVSSNVDLILACCHWGIEKDTYPENYQQVLGRKCIDWGVDLVIGHHPHVLQGIEEYKGRYIIYSLANFCFGANRNPADKDTMIFQQTFTFENGQKVEDRNARIIPCMVSSVSTRNDFKPTPAAGEDKKRILQRMNEYSRDFGVEFDENGGILVN